MKRDYNLKRRPKERHPVIVKISRVSDGNTSVCVRSTNHVSLEVMLNPSFRHSTSHIVFPTSTFIF